MEKPVNLTLTLEQYEELHRTVVSAQGKGNFVKVNREAITKLFVDHTRLLKQVPHADPSKRKLTK